MIISGDNRLRRVVRSVRLRAGAGRDPGRWTTIAFALCLATSPICPVKAEPRITTDPAQTTDLLTFIRALEAPRGYDDYERRIPIAPPRPLTQMQLGEVLEWQRRVRKAGAPSSAAGGYQIIYSTLARLVTDYNIDRSDVFNAGLQDRLARLLISECGPRPAASARSTHPRFGNCLAGIWAALPLTAGPRRGRSAYHGVAGNRALTRPETVLALLAGEAAALRRTPQPAFGSQPAGGSQPAESGPLAFEALPLSAVNDALRATAGTGRLTPSVQTWKVDPYASH